MTNLLNTIHTNRTRRGFTLVEMLVVSALIAIFAGLAVFNITAQLEREKQKAAIAEARHIATGMSWAYDDLGFFPKIGLLRFNVDNLVEFLKGAGFDSMEYHGYNVGNQASITARQWRQNYMAGGGADKTITMHYTSNGKNLEAPWPADPWGNPYVAYLLKTIPASSQGAEPKQAFITSAADKANFFAGVVSYGRNLVPGQTLDRKMDNTPRKPLRLYNEHPLGPRHYQALRPEEYTQARLDVFLDKNTDPEQPNIRDVGSDDRYYEF